MITAAVAYYTLSLAVLAVRAQDPAAAVPTAAAAANGGVYIPGGAGQVPGASLVTLGAGSDGFTAYEINGIVLAENGQQVMMTSVDATGNVVYDCQLGTDAQATCSVVQQYDSVSYAYTEPITYFGGALATPTSSIPATTTSDSALTSTTSSSSSDVSSTTSSPIIAAVTSTSASSSSSSTSTSSSVAEASSSMATATRSLVGPQANVAQSTSSNVFGAGGASASSDSSASARQAGLCGSAAVAGTLAVLLAVMA